MRYDPVEIARRVEARKKKFLTLSAIYLAVIIVAIAIPLIFGIRSLIVPGAALAIIFIFVEAGLFKKFNVKILFSPEIKGVNIKEYEYSLVKGRGKPIHRRFANLPHTYANAKEPPLRLGGTVYLRKEDGNIAEVEGLFKKHIDFYEDGDTLFKHKGAKYPEVISRETDEQPCPICGKINDAECRACAGCGLKTVEE